MVVDDDPVTCELLCEVFDKQGYVARSEQSSEAAATALGSFCPDVIVSDIRMKSRYDGLNLLDHVRRQSPETPVILMTAFGSVDTAIRAVKVGAFDYISKPFRIDEVITIVRRALLAQAPVEATANDADSEEPGPVSGLVGRNPAMLEIYKMIARLSDAPAAVLITGESGTGKELIARAIHTHGKRQAAPFVAVNCGALTETLLESELFGHVKGSFTGAVANKPGIFEQAGEGTVFLDEIGETSPALQVKLLRVLQEREIVPVGSSLPIKVSARVIAATNSNLESLTKSGSFRQDLLYRLNVINLHLPPLRDRRDDIPLLVTHLLRKHVAPDQHPPVVSDDALSCLVAYPWPGNVRELENVIERATTLYQGGGITLNDLPPKVLGREGQAEISTTDDPTGRLPGTPTIDELERQHLIHVLGLTSGNRKRAAEILGINRRTLYRMAERFGIEL
ncbi:MAG TPA: sigma-54 dependent transcriptional regulator [Pyrinomonadaceae bacterium]|nr:sigma-54 dependent transcriptional regulator [Pyrinomonadaceae bacterium]